MTNEELATLIKEGRTEYIEELWKQVERFINHKARIYYETALLHGGNLDFEKEDLVSEAYFALINSIRFFNPEKGTYLQALNYYLKHSFRKVRKYKQAETTKQYNYYSYLEQKAGSDKGENELLEYITDKDAAAEFESVINLEFLYHVRKVLINALDSSGGTDKAIKYIKMKYFEGISPDKALLFAGYRTRQDAHQQQQSVFYKIRHGKYGRILKGMLIEFDNMDYLCSTYYTERKAIKKMRKQDFILEK